MSEDEVMIADLFLSIALSSRPIASASSASAYASWMTIEVIPTS